MRHTHSLAFVRDALRRCQTASQLDAEQGFFRVGAAPGDFGFEPDIRCVPHALCRACVKPALMCSHADISAQLALDLSLVVLQKEMLKETGANLAQLPRRFYMPLGLGRWLPNLQPKTHTGRTPGVFSNFTTPEWQDT